ncbi:hypothetical protein ACLOJK_023355 [Asimina triloba]
MDAHLISQLPIQVSSNSAMKESIVFRRATTGVENPSEPHDMATIFFSVDRIWRKPTQNRRPTKSIVAVSDSICGKIRATHAGFDPRLGKLIAAAAVIFSKSGISFVTDENATEQASLFPRLSDHHCLYQPCILANLQRLTTSTASLPTKHSSDKPAITTAGSCCAQAADQEDFHREFKRASAAGPGWPRAAVRKALLSEFVGYVYRNK